MFCPTFEVKYPSKVTHIIQLVYEVVRMNPNQISIVHAALKVPDVSPKALALLSSSGSGEKVLRYKKSLCKGILRTTPGQSTNYYIFQRPINCKSELEFIQVLDYETLELYFRRIKKYLTGIHKSFRRLTQSALD